jgi:hypothetical protein
MRDDHVALYHSDVIGRSNNRETELAWRQQYIYLRPLFVWAAGYKNTLSPLDFTEL